MHLKEAVPLPKANGQDEAGRRGTRCCNRTSGHAMLHLCLRHGANSGLRSPAARTFASALDSASLSLSTDWCSQTALRLRWGCLAYKSPILFRIACPLMRSDMHTPYPIWYTLLRTRYMCLDTHLQMCLIHICRCVYIHICICMHVCMFTWLCVLTYAYIYMHTFTYIRTPMYIWICTHVGVRIDTNILIYTCTCFYVILFILCRCE